MYFEPSKAAKSRFNIIQKSAPRRTWIKGRTYERQDASRRGSPCGAFNRPFNRGFGPRPKPSISSVDWSATGRGRLGGTSGRRPANTGTTQGRKRKRAV